MAAPAAKTAGAIKGLDQVALRAKTRFRAVLTM
jgi:hypothetical protein